MNNFDIILYTISIFSKRNIKKLTQFSSEKILELYSWVMLGKEEEENLAKVISYLFLESNISGNEQFFLKNLY